MAETGEGIWQHDCLDLRNRGSGDKSLPHYPAVMVPVCRSMLAWTLAELQDPVLKK
jgi:hypothetical protein